MYIIGDRRYVQTHPFSCAKSCITYADLDRV